MKEQSEQEEKKEQKNNKYTGRSIQGKTTTLWKWNERKKKQLNQRKLTQITGYHEIKLDIGSKNAVISGP